jgi:hypothetical protein
MDESTRLAISRRDLELNARVIKVPPPTEPEGGETDSTSNVGRESKKVPDITSNFVPE